MAISSSSEFKDKINYPLPNPHICEERLVSFRTSEGIKEAAKKYYYERMTLCESTYVNPSLGDSFLYISRAYKSNEVFVYVLDRTDNKIYLENLSTNISVADELNSFDFVEE